MSVQTPNNWFVRDAGIFLRVVHGEHKITVADSIVSEAAARLIAAAPDLLAALQGILRAEPYPIDVGCDHGGNFIWADAVRLDDEAFDAARAAIAKATGGGL